MKRPKDEFILGTQIGDSDYLKMVELERLADAARLGTAYLGESFEQIPGIKRLTMSAPSGNSAAPATSPHHL